MKHLVKFPLEEGGFIWVEVEDTETQGLVPASGGGDVPRKAQKTFEAALETVRPAAAAIIRKLQALHDPPDEVTVEFGLKMSAEAGAIIASAGVEANYKITLTWKQETITE